MEDRKETHKIPQGSIPAAIGAGGVVEAVSLMTHGGVMGVLVSGTVAALAYTIAPSVVRAGKEILPDTAIEFLQRNVKGYLPGKYGHDNGKQPQQQEVTQVDALGLEPMEDVQPKPLKTNLAEDDLQSLEDAIQNNGELPGACLFSSVLRAFKPSMDQIFLGYLPGGQAVYVAVEDLCHVALAGLTGNGKTTLIRLIVSQLEYAGAKVLILNPHYTSYDIKKDEDWTPIERHLYRAPVTEFMDIGNVMKWVATVLLRERLEKYRQSIPWGSPIFVVIDELPAIVNNVPEFPEYVSAILREGRKVDILLVVASQDFLTKTVGPDEGGAVRKNYKTKMYVGGDVTTAKVLLDIPPAQIPENRLGEGIVMMRNKAVKTASLARVPYVDNEALYRLLGPSTYVPGRTHNDEDDLMAYMVSGTRSEAQEAHTDELPVTRTYSSGKRSVASVATRREAREQRLRGTVVAQQRQGEGRATAEQGQMHARVPEMIIPEQKPEPTIDDALVVWNEVVGAGGKLSRYSLQERLMKKGFECGENKARDLLNRLKAKAEVNQSVNR